MHTFSYYDFQRLKDYFDQNDQHGGATFLTELFNQYMDERDRLWSEIAADNAKLSSRVHALEDMHNHTTEHVPAITLVLTDDDQSVDLDDDTTQHMSKEQIDLHNKMTKEQYDKIQNLHNKLNAKSTCIDYNVFDDALKVL